MRLHLLGDFAALALIPAFLLSLEILLLAAFAAGRRGVNPVLSPLNLSVSRLSIQCRGPCFSDKHHPRRLRGTRSLDLEETMPAYSLADIRNIALIGHQGSGKTALGDAILHSTGVTNRLGDVSNGSSFLDFQEE